ncbi:recombinase family protein [Amaricoccus solimangrovi]|uniref:Recombinase family protein n=1 Tax=Amaricoccus solimangrovi TaxID=2589815 RepID=A0A501WXR9_9RHOB|nr:recombinase family protein [Amaricoccus solimangrovi]TPE53280.1 recombinase family protein [Amaricoccus solimangrovi]
MLTTPDRPRPEDATKRGVDVDGTRKGLVSTRGLGAQSGPSGVTTSFRLPRLRSVRGDRLIGYERVSTTRQGASGLGLEAQRQAIEGCAAQRSANLLARFTEVGVWERLFIYDVARIATTGSTRSLAPARRDSSGSPSAGGSVAEA